MSQTCRLLPNHRMTNRFDKCANSRTNTTRTRAIAYPQVVVRVQPFDKYHQVFPVTEDNIKEP
jgi:hypothetical protein